MVKRGEGVVAQRIGDELVAFVPETNEGHALNASATLIFELCEAGTSRTEIVQALAAAGLPADDAIVDLALGDLERAGLVVIDDDERPKHGVTRRRVVTGLGISAAAATVLPMVESIFIEPATAAASPVGTTTSSTFTTPFTTTLG